jgi:hypothetical protein
MVQRALGTLIKYIQGWPLSSFPGAPGGSPSAFTQSLHDHAAEGGLSGAAAEPERPGPFFQWRGGPTPAALGLTATAVTQGKSVRGRTNFFPPFRHLRRRPSNHSRVEDDMRAKRHRRLNLLPGCAGRCVRRAQEREPNCLRCCGPPRPRQCDPWGVYSHSGRRLARVASDQQRTPLPPWLTAIYGAC